MYASDEHDARAASGRGVEDEVEAVLARPRVLGPASGRRGLRGHWGCVDLPEPHRVFADSNVVADADAPAVLAVGEKSGVAGRVIRLSTSSRPDGRA